MPASRFDQPLAGEALDQGLAGADQQGFDRLDAEAEDRRRLGIGQAFIISEDDRGALPVGQGADRAATAAWPPVRVELRVGRRRAVFMIGEQLRR